MNQVLRNSNITVTLQWPRKAGAVYHVNVLPETSHTELKSQSTMTIATNLTISYDTQYNVSMISSLCGVTTTKVLNYGKCKVVESSSCTTLNARLVCYHNNIL